MNFPKANKYIPLPAPSLPFTPKFFLLVQASILIIFFMFTTSPSQSASVELNTQVELQIGLKRYIEARTVDNKYEHFNVESGKIEQLVLKNLHPVIFVTGSKYLMCADFVDSSGGDFLLDYIISLTGNDFQVEQEIRGKRSFLTKLFDRIN